MQLLTINSITLANFGNPNPASGGNPKIANYNGIALYCHVTPNAASPAKVDIAFNQNPPNEFAGHGQIASVSITFKAKNAPNPTTMLWNAGLPDGVYDGTKPIRPYFKFTDATMQVVSLVLDKNELDISVRTVRGDGKKAKPKDIPTIGLMIVGPELTLEEPRAYIVNIPLNVDADTFRDEHTARVHWPKDDGVSGPIGGVTYP